MTREESRGLRKIWARFNKNDEVWIAINEPYGDERNRIMNSSNDWFVFKEESNELDRAIQNMVQIIRNFNSKFSPGENWYPEFKQILEQYDKAVGRK